MACVRMVKLGPMALRTTEFSRANHPIGKQWHAPKKAFRPTAGLKSYEKRTQERAIMIQVKAKEKEMKEEKEDERKVSPRRFCWCRLESKI